MLDDSDASPEYKRIIPRDMHAAQFSAIGIYRTITIAVSAIRLDARHEDEYSVATRNSALWIRHRDFCFIEEEQQARMYLGAYIKDRL
jgi:hypothetical protein